MSKWKCEICGAEFENFHAQGFDNKIYCPLCYFKRKNQELKKQLEVKEAQQKEFIELLENEIKVTEDKLNKYDELVMQGKETDIEYYESMINKGIFDACKDCLSKYKNIVGGK